MDYRNLISETWKGLDNSGDLIKGYKSFWLALNDEEESSLHIFKDKSNEFHFAIEASNINQRDIENPNVNGLQIQLATYRFKNGNISQFIDLTCNISAYLEEFTEVVKEISALILEDKAHSLNAVNQIINNWISFWTNQRKEILSEDAQIGLLSELLVLENLCKINPNNALKSWIGPLGEKHDFNFLSWAFEVKGTRRSERIHTINGIDQLKKPEKKQLGFISFLFITSEIGNSINLPSYISLIRESYFNNNVDLIIRFNNLLAGVGYSPLYDEEYKKFNVELIESTFYEVNENFPKLTSDLIENPLSSRISSVRYDISLNGISGTNLLNLNWGDYFY